MGMEQESRGTAPALAPAAQERRENEEGLQVASEVYRHVFEGDAQQQQQRERERRKAVRIPWCRD
jgi:hypothetical protein